MGGGLEWTIDCAMARDTEATLADPIRAAWNRYIFFYKFRLTGTITNWLFHRMSCSDWILKIALFAHHFAGTASGAIVLPRATCYMT